MPKAQSEHLYRLIDSLNKSEKRAFQLFTGRFNGTEEKKFLLLFEAIEKHQLKSDSEILQKFPQLKSEQLSNLKANLYLQLLKSIQLLNASRLLDMKITESLDHARLLYHRCLYNDCLMIIDKAKKKAKSAGSKLLFLEILELEKLSLQKSSQSNLDKRLQINIDETVSTVDSIRNINTFSNLSLQLNSFYQKNGFIRNQKDLKRIQQFFKASVPEYNEQKMSFDERLYLYYSYSGYYFFIQDFKSGYNYAKKFNQLFIDHPDFIIKRTELYIKSINGLLVAQNKLFLFDEFMETYKRLVILKRNKKIVTTENINLNLFKAIYLHQINRHFLLGEFKSGVRIVSRLEDELAKFVPKLDNNTITLFYYKIACLYFGAGNFKSAVKWLNKIILFSDTEIREDIQAFSRIVRLICYFELENDDQVEYAIRSTYRYLLKKKTFVQYQRLILNFLRGLKKSYEEKLILEKFKVLKTDMEKLTKDPFEKRAFIYFDMISWLESKIQKKPVQDIIQAKINSNKQLK